MRDVLERMQILAAWLKPGGATPDEPIPDKYSTLVEAIAQLESLRSQVERASTALEKINQIRNSIVGTQTLNWSEHVYPLVAALGDAGLEGMSYPETKEYYGTLVERAVKAEEALAQIDIIVHTPTKETGFRSANNHFQSDFDRIRALCKPFALPSTQRQPKPSKCVCGKPDNVSCYNPDCSRPA